eukprot:Gb_11499 [translate_table: standard]
MGVSSFGNWMEIGSREKNVPHPLELDCSREQIGDGINTIGMLLSLAKVDIAIGYPGVLTEDEGRDLDYILLAYLKMKQRAKCGITLCTTPKTTCDDMTHVTSLLKRNLSAQTHDRVTSPLSLESIVIDGHRVIGRRSRPTSEDLEDGDRSQCLRHEINAKDIVPPRDSGPK